jgi:predicted DNA-binding protein
MNVDPVKNKPRTKRISTEGISEKAINFSPTVKQRVCFDALMSRTGKTQAKLGREAITMYLESQGFSKADQGIEE